MPIHDWSRVDAGTFHAFHLQWIAEIVKRLNREILPAAYYAIGEQQSGPYEPDVLTLKNADLASSEADLGEITAHPEGQLLTSTPPQVHTRESFSESMYYDERRRTVVIRHRSGRQIVAFIDLVSRGNKESRQKLEDFKERIRTAIRQGIHVLVVDLYPPRNFDPHGIHRAIVEDLGPSEFVPPTDRPLTLVSYRSDQLPEAFVEPIRVGDELPPMPLFLTNELYVNVPLEDTYTEAWSAMPIVIREELEDSSHG